MDLSLRQLLFLFVSRPVSLLRSTCKGYFGEHQPSRQKKMFALYVSVNLRYVTFVLSFTEDMLKRFISQQ